MLRQRVWINLHVVTVAVLLPVPWGLCGILYSTWYRAMLPKVTHGPWPPPAPDTAAPFLWLCSHLTLTCPRCLLQAPKHQGSRKSLDNRLSFPILYHFELQMHTIAGCPWSFNFLLAYSALNRVWLSVENKCLAPCLWQNTELMSGTPCWGPFLLWASQANKSPWCQYLSLFPDAMHKSYCCSLSARSACLMGSSAASAGN